MNLYGLGRDLQKIGSRINDVKNISKGHPEKVIKKAAKRLVFKNINKSMKGF